jgi:subtilisin family serine protease
MVVDKKKPAYEPEGLRGDPSQQIIVGFKPELVEVDRDRRNSLISAAIAKLAKEFGEILLPDPLIVEGPDPPIFFAITLLALRPDRTLAELREALGGGYEGVGWVERNASVAPDGFNDPLAAQQWALETLGATGPWTVSPPPNVRTILGIVDSGLRHTSGGLHPDIGLVEAVAVCQPANFFSTCTDRIGHGTLLAGTMAARPNGHGVASPIDPSWNISLLPVQFFGPAVEPNAAFASIAILHAAVNPFNPGHRARVITAAWHVAANAELITLKVALALARSKAFDCLVVFAAGNEGTNNEEYPIYPANFGTDPAMAGNAIVVAASDRYDGKAAFSNYGPNTVHIAAPGVHILSTGPYVHGQPRYREYSGTSASAAFVAAGAALVFALNPAWSSADVVQHLLASAVSCRDLRLACIRGRRLSLSRAVYGPLTPTAPAASASLSIGQPADIEWQVEYDNPKFAQVRITFTDQATGQVYPVATVGINTSPYVWTPTSPQLPPPPVTGWITITPTTGNFPVRIEPVTVVP